jgi:hypothetical protein
MKRKSETIIVEHFKSGPVFFAMNRAGRKKLKARGMAHEAPGRKPMRWLGQALDNGRKVTVYELDGEQFVAPYDSRVARLAAKKKY